MKGIFVRFHHFGNKAHNIALFSMVFTPVSSLFQKMVTKGDLIFGPQLGKKTT